MKERRDKTDILIQGIEKLLAREVAPVAPVLAVAPIAPVLPVAPVLPIAPEDHNLLIKLDGKVDALKDDIKALTDGTTTRITDHEIRLRGLEQRIWIFVGGLTILTFIVPYVLKVFIK